MIQKKIKPIDLNEARQACQRFSKSFDSLLMATTDNNGIPNASYAACIKEQGDYYVYISELAAHTQNIANNGRVSLLFIEDEEQSHHLFARKRLTYQCKAREIAFDSAKFLPILELFARKFGELIDVLKNLQDFHLYRLHPFKGVYVHDFARDFAIEGDDLENIRHSNGGRHKPFDRKARNRATSDYNTTHG